MYQTKPIQIQIAAALALALAAPGALAYGEKDAIRDCESKLRAEYQLSDLRDASAEKLGDSEHHYKVHGQAKVDGDKHPWTCEVKNRHVTMAEYSGPKAKGMGTAEKLAIGAATVIAAGIAVNEASKHGGEGQPSHSGPGAAGLQDLVGARASSGKSQLEERGYRNPLGFKDGHRSYTNWRRGSHCVHTRRSGVKGLRTYTNWRKGSHCVSVRTTNGHYESIIDVGADDCEDPSKQGGSHAGGGGAGAADLRHLVGARGAGGETELQRRGYNYVAGSKWSNGWHCVTVHTSNGHYQSIVDTPMANCH